MRGVTSPPPALPPSIRSRRLRDLMALLCIAMGALLVIAAAFAADPRAGCAAVGVLLLAAGVAAGIDRTPVR